MSEVEERRGADVGGGGFRGITTVEVPVAAAGVAGEGRGVAFGGGRAEHEFAAAVHGMAAQGGCMVPHAFSIRHHPQQRRRRSVVQLLGDGLNLCGRWWGFISRITRASGWG